MTNIVYDCKIINIVIGFHLIEYRKSIWENSHKRRNIYILY